MIQQAEDGAIPQVLDYREESIFLGNREIGYLFFVFAGSGRENPFFAGFFRQPDIIIIMSDSSPFFRLFSHVQAILRAPALRRKVRSWNWRFSWKINGLRGRGRQGGGDKRYINDTTGRGPETSLSGARMETSETIGQGKQREY